MNVIHEAGFSETEEQMFLSGLQAGDAKIQAIIYNMFFQRLLYFARRITRDEPAAEDIVVETFTKLFIEKYQFASLSALKGFLFIAVKNAAINDWKKTKKRNENNLEMLYLLQNDTEYINSQMLEADLFQHLRNQFNQLSVIQQVILSKNLTEGLTIREIARQLNMPENTVYSHKHRALQKLERILSHGRLGFFTASFSCLSLFVSKILDRICA